MEFSKHRIGVLIHFSVAPNARTFRCGSYQRFTLCCSPLSHRGRSYPILPKNGGTWGEEERLHGDWLLVGACTRSKDGSGDPGLLYFRLAFGEENFISVHALASCTPLNCGTCRLIANCPRGSESEFVQANGLLRASFGYQVILTRSKSQARGASLCEVTLEQTFVVKPGGTRS